MQQGRKSRYAWALLSALFALSVMAPAALGAPAAVDEYDLALPDANGPANPDSTEPEPAPVPAPTPVAPAPAPAAPAEGDASEGALAPAAANGAASSAKLDRAASRRDVLFERPENASAPPPKALYQPARESQSASAAMLGFVAIGAVCIAASLWRIRRFARDSGPRGVGDDVGDPQAS